MSNIVSDPQLAPDDRGHWNVNWRHLQKRTTQLLSNIKVPTFILAAERDIISPTLQAEALSEGISDSDVLVIPSAAHLLPVEQPEFCAKNITHFLQMATR